MQFHVYTVSCTQNMHIKNAPNRKSALQGIVKHKAMLRSSSIQTVLSAPESNRISLCKLAGYTAGGDFHPALKIRPPNASLQTVRMSTSQLTQKAQHVEAREARGKAARGERRGDEAR